MNYQSKIAELPGDPEVVRYITGERPTPRAQIRDRVLPSLVGSYQRFGGFGYSVAEHRTTGDFLGWFLFRPRRPEPREGEVELGYRLRTSAWGQGYATEGSVALILKGFVELGVERVFAEAMAVNNGSRRVMEKAGRRLVQTFQRLTVSMEPSTTWSSTP